MGDIYRISWIGNLNIFKCPVVLILSINSSQNLNAILMKILMKLFLNFSEKIKEWMI
jgi:hypothetical protein